MAHISLQDVTLDIPIFDASARRIVRLPRVRKAPGSDGITEQSGVLNIRALSEISLEVADGDRIGLIGHNGSGKTTLLRLLAGAYTATSGTVKVEGRVQSLLEPTLAANADATGIENIRLAAILNEWGEDRIEQFIEDVAEFTELGPYLSLPTRVYSAGMGARLAFAIATLFVPEVLLIDEGIGAGDAAFQEKAEERISRLVGDSRIMFVASHSASLLEGMCNKGVVMSNGAIDFTGSIDDALKYYVG